MNEVQFSVTINRKEWLELNPHLVTYADKRSYMVFDDLWTTMMNSKIWEATRTPCKWSFNHLKFHSNPKYAAFTFDAACTAYTSENEKHNTKCGNFLFAKCCEIPENQEDIEINMTMSDTSGIPHFGKRYFAGKARKDMKKYLKNAKAVAFQVEQANAIMQTSDIVPPHIPNLEVLRKMRMEKKNESLNLDLYPGDPFTSLCRIQEQNNFIRSLSASPFNVQYFTDDQKKMFREALEHGYHTLSIDASGFSRSFEIISGMQSGPIFMYDISLNVLEKIVSVGSMLSEAHDTVTIADWLSRWLDFVNVRPRVIVVDGSLALLNAITLALYDCSYQDYVEWIFHIVLEHETIMSEFLQSPNLTPSEAAFCKEKLSSIEREKPDVLLFRDRNHLIKNVRNWNCFDARTHWRIKDFYTRVVGYMLNIDSIKLLKDTLMQVFTVSHSDFTEPGTKSAEALHALLTKIEQFSYEISFEEDGKGADINHYASSYISEQFAAANVNNVPYDSTKFVDDICNLALLDCQIQSTSDFPDPNPYKCAAFVDHFKPLAYQFVTFTNVTDQCYQGIPATKTSCPSEIRFGTLKTGHGLKYDQAHKLILRHVKINRGECLLARGYLKRQFLLNQEKANGYTVSSDSASDFEQSCEFSSRIPVIAGTRENQGNCQGSKTQSEETDETVPESKRNRRFSPIKYPAGEADHVSSKNKKMTNQIIAVGPQKSIIDLTKPDTASSKKDIDCDLPTLVTATYLFRGDGYFTVYRLKKASKYQSYCIFSCTSEYCSLLKQANVQILYNENILCLEVPRYINNFVIDFFMALKFETVWKNEAMSFLPSSYTSLILGEGSSKVFNKENYSLDHWIFQNKINSEPKVIFLPYALGSHWCLVVLNLCKSTFAHYDSLRWNRDEIIKSKFDKFLQYCREINKPGPFNLASKNWRLVIPDDRYPKQKDGFNCGCFVMYFMDKYKDELDNNLEMANVDFHPDLYRIDLLKYFSSQSSTDICMTCGSTENGAICKNACVQRKTQIRRCQNCSFWNHESCHPSQLFIENLCLICHNSDSIIRPSTAENCENNNYIIGFSNSEGKNICWLNSCLQILLPFTTFSNVSNHFALCESDPAISKFFELQGCWRRQLPKSQIDKAVEEFRKSLRILTDKDENFVDCKQKDAAEFLIKFLNFIHKQYARKVPEELNPIQSNFRFQIQKIQICQNCQMKNIDHTYADGFVIHAPLLEGLRNQNLDEILRNLLKAEMQSLDCSICGKMNHLTTYRWASFPPCLIIVLQRFVYQPEEQRTKRLETFVSIPEILAGDVFDQHRNYSLSSMICHYGHSAQSGHYFCYVRHGETWYYYDDNISYEKLPTSEHFEKNSYVLVYKVRS